ncbi:hypothetical protein BSKO_08057 [Bryopsis sp. KO-2023]|nr:hypothetical protein BSKO_08057 [Bryopsis sp. KO-2023]
MSRPRRIGNGPQRVVCVCVLQVGDRSPDVRSCPGASPSAFMVSSDDSRIAGELLNPVIVTRDLVGGSSLQHP